MFRRYRLPNKLTTLEVPMTSSESVVVTVLVKVGSRYETRRLSGISHFLEHLFFKGSKKYPSAVALSETIDAIGGEWNAETGKEHTQYYIKAAAKHLPLIFDVLSDMLQHPLFDEKEIEREKGVISEELNMYKDTPMRHVQSVLEQIMWPRQPLGWDIGGEKDIIRKFTRKDFLDYVGTHYQPQNLIIGIGGKFKRSEIAKLLSQYWRNLPTRRTPRYQRASDRQHTPAIRVEYKKTEQAHIALGFKSYSYRHKKLPALGLIAAILGGGMSSRLFVEIRERRGLAYYVRSDVSIYQDTGNFSIQAGLQVGKTAAAISVIVDELKKLATEEVRREELAKAKEYIKGKVTLALEDNQNRLAWFLEHEAFHPQILTPEQFFRRIDRVTAGEIRAVASEILRSNHANLAVIGPFRETKEFAVLLKW
jgi:predicted Zn-dependent peptidase